jgi:uncharacterized protein (TIGR02452 family)
MTSTFHLNLDSFNGQERWGNVRYYVDDQGAIQLIQKSYELPQYIKEKKGHYEKRQHYITDLAKYVMQDNFKIKNQKDFFVFETQDNQLSFIDKTGARMNLDWKPAEPHDNTFKLTMCKGDTLEVAKAFYQFYNKWPLILNFASPFQPGGDFKSGAKTQEEMLMYRSSYYHSLNAAYQLISQRGMLNVTDFDAISMNKPKYIPFHRCIYSPHVYIYGNLHKDNKGITLDPSQTKKVSMIAAAAPCFIGNNTKWTSNAVSALTTMWTTIIKTAMNREEKNLLLGSIGCGAFAPKRNTVDYKHLVALTLCEVLGKYGKYFDNIIFADYDTKNYYIFEQEFKKHQFDPQEEFTQASPIPNDPAPPKPNRETPSTRKNESTPNRTKVSQNQSQVTQVLRNHTIPSSPKNILSSADSTPKHLFSSPDQTPKNVPSSPDPKNLLPSKNHVPSSPDPKNPLPSSQENIQSSPSIAFLGTIYLCTFIASTIAISMR